MKVIPSGTKAMVIDYDDNLKNHLRLFDDTDEVLVKGYIRAAGDYIEKYVGRPILSTSMTVIGNADKYWFELPKGTTIVTAIQERQSDGTWLDVEPENETMDDYGVYTMYYDETLTDGMEYKFEVLINCQVSDLVKQAAYLIVAEMYEQRENRGIKYPQSAGALLDMESLLL